MVGEIKHYWCQKILPLVYDNSLSYYEVLCKLTDKINEVIKAVNTFKVPESKRRIILLGDSYASYGAGGVEVGKNYIDFFREYLPDNAELLFSYDETPGVANGGFLRLLKKMKISDPASITDILIVGGRADTIQDYHELDKFKSSTNELTDYIKQNFPNATKTNAFIYWHRFISDELRQKTLTAYTRWNSTMHEAGWASVANIEYIMHNDNLFNADGTHPNLEGMSQIGGSLACWLSGVFNSVTQIGYTLQPVNGTFSGDRDVVIRRYNEYTRLSVWHDKNWLFTPTEEIKFTFDGANDITIGLIEQSLIHGYQYQCGTEYECLMNDGNSNYYRVNGRLYFDGRLLKFRPRRWAETSGGGTITKNIKNIAFGDIELDCPTMLC